MTEIHLNRSNYLIDPQLHIWGWEIPVYLFLGGLTAGVMILSALLRRNTPQEECSQWVRWLPFAAPVLLSVGMLALLFDLEYKFHVFRFYTTFEWTSPMSWGSWILIAIYPATILLGLTGINEKEMNTLVEWKPLKLFLLGGLIKWIHEIASQREEGLRWINVALGISLGIYTGILLGTIGARPAWNSAVLGPLFLVSGISTGAAFMMLFPISQGEHHSLRGWDLAAIGIEMVLIVLFLLHLTTGSEASRQAAQLFLGGQYTALFWSLVIIAGLTVPFLIEVVEARRHFRPTFFAPVLLLVGGLSLRWILVSAGQA